jgi:hypothetical protein
VDEHWLGAAIRVGEPFLIYFLERFATRLEGRQGPRREQRGDTLRPVGEAIEEAGHGEAAAR